MSVGALTKKDPGTRSKSKAYGSGKGLIDLVMQSELPAQQEKAAKGGTVTEL